MTLALVKSLLRKEEILPELNDSIVSLNKCIIARRARSATQLALIDEMLQMIQKEAPRFEKPVSYALDPYRTIALIEQEFALAEERFKDDLLDIVERYKVVQQHQSEYQELLRALADANTAINHAKLTITTDQTQADAVESASSLKKELLLKAKQKTQELIEEKQKFSKFKMNRLAHAWQYYSSALENYGSKGAEYYESMTRAFTGVRKQISDLCAHTKEYDEAEQFTIAQKHRNIDLTNPFETMEAQ